MSTFADDLIAAIGAKQTPICVGIDPMYDRLPEAVAGPAAARNANDTTAVLDAYYAFVTGVLQTVAELVPVVKFQSAYFEQYHAEGVAAYYDLVGEAKRLGLLVIGDVKRGDIGSTSAAYAAGHLCPAPETAEDVTTPDAVTVNPMLGLDTLEPFAQQARTHGKGLFVLVRTSNPGSAQLQDAQLADGRTWSEALADALHATVVSADPPGTSGYASTGVVVGATQAHTIASMRRRLPRSIFLLPGYGTQGATAEMTRAAFDEAGLGAIVSASRSVLYPDAAGGDWKAAVRAATLAMKSDIAAILAR